MTVAEFIGSWWQCKGNEQYIELIAVVDRRECIGCRDCIDVCPLLRAADKLEVETCTGCGSCLSACSENARVRIPRHLIRISRVLSRTAVKAAVTRALNELPKYNVQLTDQLLRVVATRTGLPSPVANSPLSGVEEDRKRIRVEPGEKSAMVTTG